MIELKAKLDTKHDGKGTRYIIGKPGAEISGAVYFKGTIPVPDTLVITIGKETTIEQPRTTA